MKGFGPSGLPDSGVCAECGRTVPAGHGVGLNGRYVCVEPCFAKALRETTFTPAELAVKLDPSMPPEVVYRAGKTTVATIVAARRKAKKR